MIRDGSRRTLPIVFFVVIFVASSMVGAQTRDKGLWWPHPIWGPDDQAGASNWITPAKIVESLSLVKTGKVYEIGQVYRRGMPLYGTRTFAMFSAGPFGPFGGNAAIARCALEAVDAAEVIDDGYVCFGNPGTTVPSGAILTMPPSHSDIQI